MPDYQKGKIYRIVCNETGEQYIGSTTQTLAQRLGQHKSKSSSKQYTSWQIIERMNYEIVLIEECPCENKNQLGRQERHFIENMECVNKNIPTRTDVEWQKANPEKCTEKRRKWQKANPEKCCESASNWRKANPEKYTEYNRNWRKANTEKIAEYKRKYYERKKLEKELIGKDSPCG